MTGLDPIIRKTFRSLVAGEGAWPAFIHGPAGVGKTCAALCLLDYAAGQTQYLTASSLCRQLIDAGQGRLTWYTEGRGGSVTEEMLWTRFASASLVVLDELGCRDRVSDHHYDSVKRLIDERYGKPLLVVSNLDLGTVSQLYDDRIASRLAAGTVVRLEGKDRRVGP